jgi:endonuclease YncB( thermonuclease family)
MTLWRRASSGLWLAVFLLVFSVAADAADVIAGRASIIDGDTIEIRGQRIRLFGIDAPEAGQTCRDSQHNEYRCGQKAALVLDARIGDGVVTCERKDTDRYGRTVSICRVYGEDLGAWMVGLGWAVASRAYTTRYGPAEDLARTRRAGMWAGTFTPPAEWRREHDPRLR